MKHRDISFTLCLSYAILGDDDANFIGGTYLPMEEQDVRHVCWSYNKILLCYFDLKVV